MAPTKVPLLDDDQLMCRVQANETGAFAELYDRHIGRALLVARAVIPGTSRAEDAVQEGFLSIWRSRSSYRPGSGSFQGWAMRIIRNRAIDSLRRDAALVRPQLIDADDVDRAGSTAQSVEAEVISASEAGSLRMAISRLPDAQAEVITLAYFGELSHTEIATELGVPNGTVKGRMRLGLEKLRLQLEGSRHAPRLAVAGSDPGGEPESAPDAVRIGRKFQ